MIFCADPQEATDSVQISAAPPFCSISCLVCCAGLADPPSPVSDAPISATITLAPAAAIMRAISRPIPPPAPVTTATLPFIMPGIIFLLVTKARLRVLPPAPASPLPRGRRSKGTGRSLLLSSRAGGDCEPAPPSRRRRRGGRSAHLARDSVDTV